MTRFPLFVAALVTSAVLALGSCTYLGSPVRTAPNSLDRSPTFEALTTDLKVAKFETKKHHLLLISNDVSSENQPYVNIYLEGDGVPWSNRVTISTDPSPRYPLALHLMSLDPAPAFYITRPCYHQQITANCHADLWTFGRYSQEVVDALAEVVQSILVSMEASVTVTLVGYSGGGTLALLLAAQLEGIDRVVTVAGNVDTDAWTALHGYTPLHNSLNPASIVLPENIRYTHLLGGEDKNIPPLLGQSVYARSAHTTTVIEDFDHRCCWAEQWPDLLLEIKKQ